MSSPSENFEKGLVRDPDSGSDGKGRSSQTDDVGKTATASGLPATQARVFQAPESIRNLSPGERAVMENKLKRKIDFRLMPMIIIMYIMNYLDRNNIAAAKLAGLPEDLGLKGAEFQVRSLCVLAVVAD